MTTHEIDKIMAEALAAMVISTTEGHEKRLSAARVGEHTGVVTFASIAVSGARVYERQATAPGSPTLHIFNRATVLHAAALIAAHYAALVEDMDQKDHANAR